MRKVFIECMQEIPCNPCASACPKGAITVGPPITSLPVVNEEKCIGCGICVASCPGQACFLLDMEFSDCEATIDLPYEFLPLPSAGDTVAATGRSGEYICGGRIVNVINPAKYNHTPIIRMAVPKEYIGDVRSFRFPPDTSKLH